MKQSLAFNISPQENPLMRNKYSVELAPPIQST